MDRSVKQSRVAVTVCARNFLSKALDLRESWLACHPESDFYIVIIEPKDDSIQANLPEVKILWAENLGILGYRKYAFRYDVIELSTNVKPTVLLHLLKQYEKVVYLDPDICLFADINPVFDAL